LPEGEIPIVAEREEGPEVEFFVEVLDADLETLRWSFAFVWAREIPVHDPREVHACADREWVAEHGTRVDLHQLIRVVTGIAFELDADQSSIAERAEEMARQLSDLGRAHRDLERPVTDPAWVLALGRRSTT
jgi:hypothetical protein